MPPKDMANNNFPDCLRRSILALASVLDQGGWDGGVSIRDRREDAALLRLAFGEGPAAVCGHRSRETGAWWDRVYCPGFGLRSKNYPARSPRAGGGRGCCRGAHPQKRGGRPPRAVAQPAL